MSSILYRYDVRHAPVNPIVDYLEKLRKGLVKFTNIAESALESAACMEALAIKGLMKTQSHKPRKHKISAPRGWRADFSERYGKDSYLQHIDNRVEIIGFGVKIWGADRA